MTLSNSNHAINDSLDKRPTLLEFIDTRLHAFVSMDAVPTIDPSQHDSAGLLLEVEQILSARKYGSRFTKATASRFQQDSKVARRDFFARVALIGTIIYDLFLFADSMVVSDVIWTAVFLQLCIGTPAAIIGVWLVRSRELDPTVPSIIVLAIMISTTIIVFYLSHTHYILLFICVFPLYLISMNLGQALPFKPAVLATVAFTTAFIIAIFMHPDIDRTAQIFSALTLISTGYYTLVGNYRIEASFRFSYLYALRESLRSHILACTNSELETMVHIDGLTGVGNRRYFDETIHRIWRHAQTNIAVLLIDIDFFKTLNDSHGHQAGDCYLRGLAQVLANGVAQNGTVARYGGEEFVAILPDLSMEAALTVAERLRRSVEALTIRFDDAHDIRSTVSIGCAVCVPSPGISASDIVAAADAALYQAKTSGRNRTRMASDNLNIAA